MANDYFNEELAVKNVVAAQVRGIIASAEIQGTEIPGALSAGNDAARETIVVLLLLSLVTATLQLTPDQSQHYFNLFILGWLIWKTGRSAWLGWSRLERLHRILEQEKWEIEHNREKERDELKVIYGAKGFEGKLLDEVLDVLMADGDRLLKIMIEEEYGLSLEVHEHPLRQGLGAFLGVLISVIVLFIFHRLWGDLGLYAASGIIIGVTGYFSAVFEGNKAISAIVWNLAIAFLAFGSTKFLLDFMIQKGWLA